MNSVNSFMTKTEFAAYREVGKSAVSNWATKGLLVMAEVDGRALVDVKRTEMRLNGALDPTRGRPSNAQQAAGAPVPPSGGEEPPAQGEKHLGQLRGELLAEQRVGARIRNARDAGDLVPLAEAEWRIGQLGRLARERMHVLARDLAEKLAAAKDSRQVIMLLTAAIDATFNELADQVEEGEIAAPQENLDAEDEDLEAA